MDMTHLKTDYFDSMLRVRKGYARVLEPICRQWDLTRNELDVLLFLANNPGFDRAADIVARRGMAKSHVSLSVSTLEEKGLLTRRCDPADRRTVHLALSPQAVEIARIGREAQVEFFGKVYKGLTEGEIIFWQSILDKVSQNIRELEL